MTKPPTHDRVLAQTAKVNDRIRRATEQLNALLDARRALYAAARDRDDPVPYRRLAEAAGTTEAAVMQVVKKAMIEQAVADRAEATVV